MTRGPLRLVLVLIATSAFWLTSGCGSGAADETNGATDTSDEDIARDSDSEKGTKGSTDPDGGDSDDRTTDTSVEPTPPTTVAPPESPEVTKALVAGLAGRYHQVRGLDTVTEQTRVLDLYDDATYEFRIESIGYYETGVVVADPTTIEFIADGTPDPNLTFAGRGVAAWTIGPGDYAPGLVLALQFPDGRGYGYDGYDHGVDLYFVDD
jgi:hypothetical protein